MTTTKIQHSQIIQQFAAIMGQEKAASLIGETAREAGVTFKSEYEKEEVAKLCVILKKNKEPSISILAMCLTSQLRLHCKGGS